jgi:hypothetical protein
MIIFKCNRNGESLRSISAERGVPSVVDLQYPTLLSEPPQPVEIRIFQRAARTLDAATRSVAEMGYKAPVRRSFLPSRIYYRGVVCRPR